MNIINWLNINSGFVMSILTFVYVIATILICYFNYKTTQTTKKQIEEANVQFTDNNRAHIVPKIIELEGEIVCLSFQNIGNNIATDVVIKVDEEWLTEIEKTSTFPETAENLRKLKEKKVFLTVNQQLCYGLCIPGNGKDDYKVLSSVPIKINISYNTLGNSYNEYYEIPLDGYNYLVNTSDYVRLAKKQIQEIKNINNELKKINNNLKNK